jgi:predicted Zn-dependent protease
VRDHELSAQQAVETALRLSRADSSIVIANAISDANLRWANNTLTTNGVTRYDQLTVVAIVGESVGVVSRTGVAASDVEGLVRAAENTARSAAPAEDRLPLVGADGDSGEWDAPPADTSIEVFARFTPGLAEALDRAASSGQLLYGYASHEMSTSYVGTSAGLRARFDQPTGYVEINAKDATMSRSAWSGVATPDFQEVDAVRLTDDLGRRLDWAKRQVELPAGRYETLLPPSAVADLMIYLYWSAGARDASDGRTVFSRPGGGTRVGERVGGNQVTLRSDPAAFGIECPPFVIAHRSSGDLSVFDNGLPLQGTAWIDGGILTSLIQTRHSAELTGLPVTPYVDNLILDGSPRGSDLDSMVADTERGLLLTSLWYIREVDPQTLLLTGLTRDGVYLVEDGEVTGAVNNFRFNESPVGLLGRIAQIGSTVRTLPREWSDNFTRTAMPPLRVEGFNMSSVSQAS